jgi:hypothetical protein
MEFWRAGALHRQLRFDLLEPAVQKLRRTDIGQCVGLDVSEERTSICVVERGGKTL